MAQRIRGISLYMADQAAEALAAGDADGILICESNERGLNIVMENAALFRERGIYEAALLRAWTMTRTNWVHFDLETLQALFKIADTEKLRAAGDPLPAGGRFTLYRGVAGRGARRKEPGPSWTRSPGRAAWFAMRLSLPNPAVLRTEIDAGGVLAYLGENVGRGEDDFLVFAERWDRLPELPQPELPERWSPPTCAP